MLLIGISALLVVVAVVTILVIVLAGGGMTPEKYKEVAKPIHDKFMEPFEKMDETWNNLPEDTTVAFDYTKLQSMADDLIGECQTAEEKLGGITAPKETSLLNQDLLDYYQEVEAYLTEAMGVFDYVIGWDNLTEEWNNTPYSASNIDTSWTIPQISGAIQQDIAVFTKFLGKLNAMNPPKACKTLHDKTVSLFQEEQMIFQRFNEAASRMDVDTLWALSYEWEVFAENKDDALSRAFDSVSVFFEKFDDLLKQGQDLQQQFDGTKIVSA